MNMELLKKKLPMLAVAAATFMLIFGGQQVYNHYWGKAPAPTICLLAGEGVAISLGDSMILMDAFFREGFPEDQLMSEGLKNTLWMAEPPYNETDLITVSHKHIDHFDPGALMAHLSRNPDVKLLLPVEAYQDFLATNGSEMFTDQIVALTPDRGTPETLEINGGTVTVYNLDHSTEVENIGVLFTLGGKSFFHMGDFSAADFEENGIKDIAVDYLLLPYWYLRNEENFQLIKDNMNPKYLVPIHMPRRDLPDDFAERVGGFDQLFTDVSTRADNVLMLYEEGSCLQAVED